MSDPSNDDQLMQVFQNDPDFQMVLDSMYQDDLVQWQWRWERRQEDVWGLQAFPDSLKDNNNASNDDDENYDNDKSILINIYIFVYLCSMTM